MVNLKSMRDAARNAVIFVEGLSREEFLADRRTQQAVAMSLIITGEHANTILKRMPEFQLANPGIALDEMRGMRNRIAHDYFTLSFPTVWTIVSEELPPLIERLDALLG